MKGKIIGVSLGPGEPELITLKALKALDAADVIYCPATRSADGMVKSRALDILRHLPVDMEKVQSCCGPMSRHREEALNAYDEVCAEMIQLAGEGKTVAVTAEGDACFYSSANYMYEKLCQNGFPVEMVAGVPAFIAAGTSVGLHLVKQRERLVVVPGDVVLEELLEAVVAKRTLVIMKVPLGEAVLRPFIARHTELQYHYFEQVGTPDEYYTASPEEILNRDFTYFSILVIRPA
ncbi:MAG: precorrin-2 C(20)-methyltransferase [Odoribacter sp.]|nr:precorrin-2 C(20)-methyltransferase [Odoribacter sp.]